MREIVIDTETTGLEPGEGHRVVEIGALDVMPETLERVGEVVPFGSGLDHHRIAGRAEIDECCGLGRVEAPVDQSDERLDVVEDDGGAAGTAKNILAKTRVGSRELRGRLPPSTRLATGLPSSSTGTNEKSVS